jgi:diadenosine tetraphosphate (Ap4A) HIT family hydrolase
MRVVYAVEAPIRETLGAEKMNLASLGNMTPHVHWHVVPRFADDRHFPTPIWSAPKREAGCRASASSAPRASRRRSAERLG